MPVPSVITDLSTTASSNSPSGSDSPATADDFFRAHASFIAQNYVNKLDKAGTVTPTANQPMGTYKHTGAGTAMSAGEYVVWNQTGVKFPAMGIGVASSSWSGSGVYAVDVAVRGAVYGDATNTYLTNNSYFDGTNYRAKETAAGSILALGPGTVTAYTLASVSAGATQTATSRLQVKSGGQTRFMPLASDPSGAEAGDVYYSSTTGSLRVYDGTASEWLDLPGGGALQTVSGLDYLVGSDGTLYPLVFVVGTIQEGMVAGETQCLVSVDSGSDTTDHAQILWTVNCTLAGNPATSDDSLASSRFVNYATDSEVYKTACTGGTSSEALFPRYDALYMIHFALAGGGSYTLAAGNTLTGTEMVLMTFSEADNCVAAEIRLGASRAGTTGQRYRDIFVTPYSAAA